MSATALTSVDRVKMVIGQTGDANNALLKLIVDGVSSVIEGFIGRQIGRRDIVESHYLLETEDQVHTIVLAQYPVLAIASVKENDGTALVAGTAYRIRPAIESTSLDVGVPTRLTRLSGNKTIRWTSGEVEVTYTAGYEPVPDSLVAEATMQAAFEWRQTQPGGNRLGLTSSAPPSGGGETKSYVPHELLPGVKQAAMRFRRRF